METMMIKKRLIASRGFTLIELLTAVAIMVIVILAIGMALVDGQRGWNYMYNRIYSDVVTDGYIARKKFDAVMRKASREKFLIDPAGGWVEVYYYASDASTVVDRYARFYYASDGNKLNVEYGKLDPKATDSIETVCGNVSSCTFVQLGRSIQMILKLDNGTQKNTLITSAVTNN
jgi:prepilin-type N-terminal cleavage/methylation domain-containing protein